MKNMIMNAKTGKQRTEGKLFHLLAVLGLVMALGVPALAQPAQGEGQTASDFDYSSQSLRVAVWMDGQSEDQVLQKGEYFRVGFQANQDAYAVVYRIDAEGGVSILWPRDRYDDGFVFGGHEYLLPVSGAKRLVAGDVAGEGFVNAIVSTYPFDLRDLELDFHHESADQRYGFQVAGDPYLAMNEVNFVVTGLEDSEDYVITNYLSYYVHHKVEHPRYLCNQCHFEDDVAYDPYEDECVLEIQSDYGWNNNWYDTYEYYPVYTNPVYVYVDPWTWRPWINFWYDPWYRCAPGWGWGWGWNYHCYGWYDSPYYWGNSYTYYGNGYRRWGPLDRSRIGDTSRTKTREYGRVTGLLGKDGPTDRQREAMRTRTQLADARRDDRSVGGRKGAPGGIRGEARADRDRLRIDANTQVRGSGGLRIRDNTRVRSGADPVRPAVRHTAGGNNARSTLKPVNRTSADKPALDSRVRGSKPARPSGSPGVRADKPGTRNPSVKPVEPRRRGTRVWNTRPSSSKQPSRSSGSSSIREGSPRKPSTVPSPSGSSSRSRGSKPVVQPRSRSGSTGSKPANPPKVRSKSSGNNNSKVKSSGSRSSGSKSSGTRSSGSRSSGGKSSGSSRGGSTRR